MTYSTSSPMLKELLAAGMARFSADNLSIIKPDGTVWGSKVANPTISPDGIEQPGPVEVTLAVATELADIYFTTDNSEPTADSPQYDEPFELVSTTQVRAIAIKAGFIDSDVVSAQFIINGTVATPTFDPVAGAVPADTEVAIECATEGASIFYTTNGDAPTSASTPYTVPVVVDEAMTIKAIAIKDLFTNSAVGQAAYTIAP